MRPITVSLGPDAALILQVDDHSIAIPADEAGMAALVRILQARAHSPRPRIGTEASPVQALVDLWLHDNTPSRGLQLAGKARQRAEIRAATGVRVRDAKPSALTYELDTEGIEI